VSESKRVCGIDVTMLNYKVKDDLMGCIDEHKCDMEDEGAMEVVFLKEIIFY